MKGNYVLFSHLFSELQQSCVYLIKGTEGAPRTVECRGNVGGISHVSGDPGHIVLDGDPAPPREAQPQFSTHARRGQTAGWIKMPVGTEVGLGQGEFDFDGHPPPPRRGARPPIFG